MENTNTQQVQKEEVEFDLNKKINAKIKLFKNEQFKLNFLSVFYAMMLAQLIGGVFMRIILL